MDEGYVEAQPVPPPIPDKAGGMAIAALVLGILSFCCCGMIAGIPAFIIGYIENGKINRGESSEKGKWMALVGIVMGIISLVMTCLWVAWIVFFNGMAVMQQMHP